MKKIIFSLVVVFGFAISGYSQNPEAKVSAGSNAEDNKVEEKSKYAREEAEVKEREARHAKKLEIEKVGEIEKLTPAVSPAKTNSGTTVKPAAKKVVGTRKTTATKTKTVKKIKQAS